MVIMSWWFRETMRGDRYLCVHGAESLGPPLPNTNTEGDKQTAGRLEQSGRRHRRKNVVS